MKAVFRFFSESAWSILATLKTAIYLLIFRLVGLDVLQIPVLVFASILSMWGDENTLAEKLVFSSFLALLFPSKIRLRVLVAAMVSIPLIHTFKKKIDMLRDLVVKNRLLKYSMFALIGIWMVGIVLISFRGINFLRR